MEQIERSESPETEQSSSHALGHLRFCFCKRKNKALGSSRSQPVNCLGSDETESGSVRHIRLIRAGLPLTLLKAVLLGI